ncbi:MAG: hypothetical protein NT150_00155 [Bacteroidetes bacterium]|nr:hypothetical protein [Bacteroidota bacterium]
MRYLPFTTEKQLLDLEKGEYYIDFVGGWYVRNFGQFAINIFSKDGQSIVKIEEVKWKPQLYEKNKRTKRFFKFQIEKAGNYYLELKNPQDLVIRATNLPMWNIIFNFLEPNGIPKEHLEIKITKISPYSPLLTS